MRRSIVSVAMVASLLLGASLAAEAAAPATAAAPVETKVAATKDCSKLKTKKAQKRCAAKHKSGDTGSSAAPATGSNPK